MQLSASICITLYARCACVLLLLYFLCFKVQNKKAEEREKYHITYKDY